MDLTGFKCFVPHVIPILGRLVTIQTRATFIMDGQEGMLTSI